MFVARFLTVAAFAGLAALGAACGADPAVTSDASGAAAPAPAAPPAGAAAAVSPEGQWFVETGCSQCHAVSVYGVKPPAEIGPDLALAVEDVQTRFGVSLEEFLENPSGTMALVLSSQIQLTPEQKKVALEKLHQAFEAHKAAGGGAASH